MIGFNHFALAFADKTILNIDKLEIPPETLLPVIGRNGSGKTSLLRAAAGLTAADGVLVQGRIVYQPQNPYIFHTSCEKNILSAMQTPDRQRARQLLELFGLDGFAAKKAVYLSGGGGWGFQPGVCRRRRFRAAGAGPQERDPQQPGSTIRGNPAAIYRIVPRPEHRDRTNRTR